MLETPPLSNKSQQQHIRTHQGHGRESGGCHQAESPKCPGLGPATMKQKASQRNVQRSCDEVERGDQPRPVPPAPGRAVDCAMIVMGCACIFPVRVMCEGVRRSGSVQKQLPLWVFSAKRKQVDCTKFILETLDRQKHRQKPSRIQNCRPRSTDHCWLCWPSGRRALMGPKSLFLTPTVGQVAGREGAA